MEAQVCKYEDTDIFELEELLPKLLGINDYSLMNSEGKEAIRHAFLEDIPLIAPVDDRSITYVSTRYVFAVAIEDFIRRYYGDSFPKKVERRNNASLMDSGIRADNSESKLDRLTALWR